MFYFLAYIKLIPILGELNLSNGERWDLALRDSIFLHPYLKSLSIYGATMKDFCCFNESRKYTTSLEELTMRGCDIGAEALGKTLAVPRALRRLTFKGTLRQGTLRAGNVRQQYIDCIAQQAHSLLALDLDFPIDTCRRSRNCPADFQSLYVLQQLATTVDVIEGNLVPWVSPLTLHLFPVSLQHLHIIYDNGPGGYTRWDGLYAEAVHRWVVDDTLPNLSTVTFGMLDRRNNAYLRAESDILFPNTNVVLRRRQVQPEKAFPDIECLCCESWTDCGNPYGL